MGAEDCADHQGNLIDFYGERWPGCKKGDGFVFFPNALTDLMTTSDLSMGARELLRLYCQMDYKGHHLVECSDDNAARRIGRKRRQVQNYKHELLEAQLINVEAGWDRKTHKQETSIISLLPLKEAVSELAVEQRKQKVKAKQVSRAQDITHGESPLSSCTSDEEGGQEVDDEQSRVQHLAEPCATSCQTLRNILPDPTQDIAQIEGSYKDIQRTVKGLDACGDETALQKETVQRKTLQTDKPRKIGFLDQLVSLALQCVQSGEDFGKFVERGTPVLPDDLESQSVDMLLSKAWEKAHVTKGEEVSLL